MVMTVLEARVPNERLAEVEPLFSLGTAQLPPEILATYLVRDANEPTLFRLNTVWRTREALEAMRGSGLKTKGVQMFEAVGAHPTLSIFDVVVSRTR